MKDNRTFGPAYNAELDETRIKTQMESVLNFCLERNDKWLTLGEMRAHLKYPEASLSAQLRHLRKKQFGGYVVEKRRRGGTNGLWEYRVSKPVPPEQEPQGDLFGAPKKDLGYYVD